MKWNNIKNQLFDSISSIVSESKNFIHHPTKAFSRTSPLNLKTMLYAILAMDGNSLSKKLLRLNLPVQHCYQIKSQAFY